MGIYIHLMVESEPKISPLQMIRVLKQQSTHMMWLSDGGFLKKHFGKKKLFGQTVILFLRLVKLVAKP